MASLSIRVDLDDDGRLGPGKVLLLERIEQHGSISAAGRSMNMSYRRAWELVSEMNACFREPLVTAKMGGRQGVVPL
jgi:molybdate transport system regulatory protein